MVQIGVRVSIIMDARNVAIDRISAICVPLRRSATIAVHGTAFTWKWGGRPANAAEVVSAFSAGDGRTDMNQ